jgi:hypothetical protein
VPVHSLIVLLRPQADDPRLDEVSSWQELLEGT